jgi:flagellar P-ring protein precursor FlgI
MTSSLSRLLLILVLAGGAALQAGPVVRVKDAAFALGVTDNQLYGIGLVAGLASDGDKDPEYTLQAMANAFQSVGITIPKERITSKNVAVVLVTATISPFMKVGNKIDVKVSLLEPAVPAAELRSQRTIPLLVKSSEAALCNEKSRLRW